jgi:sterol desaturase/sphingolipid hydroxylase (fatty acid hydroxylase superfamily)
MFDPKKMTRREAPVEHWLDMAYAETVLSMIRKHLLLYGLLLLPAAGIVYWIGRRSHPRKVIQRRVAASVQLVQALFSIPALIAMAAYAIPIVWLSKRGLIREFEHPQPLAEVAYGVFYFVLLICIHELYQYAEHRLMHTPFLFRHIHYVHHQAKNPVPTTTYFFHPIEALIHGMWVIIPMLLPVSWEAFSVWFFFSVVFQFNAHQGYEVLSAPWLQRTGLIRYFNTSTAHTLHHACFPHCYFSLYTFVLDRLLGTTHPLYEAIVRGDTPMPAVPYDFTPGATLEGQIIRRLLGPASGTSRGPTCTAPDAPESRPPATD